MAWKETLDGAMTALEEAAAEIGFDDIKKWAVENGGFEGAFASLALSNIGQNVGALTQMGYPPAVLATIVLVIGQLSQPAPPEEGTIQ